MLLNFVYMQKINPLKPSFSNDHLSGLYLNFQRSLFVNARFAKMPSFPFIKLFLSQINFPFNNKDTPSFYRNISNIHRIQLMIKNFDKRQGGKANRRLVFENSLVLGSFFENISSIEQNHFDKQELNIVHTILECMKELVVSDRPQFKKKVARLRDKVDLFKKEHVCVERSREEVVELLS